MRGGPSLRSQTSWHPSLLSRDQTACCWCCRPVADWRRGVYRREKMEIKERKAALRGVIRILAQRGVRAREEERLRLQARRR